jgi:hypothetical protein
MNSNTTRVVAGIVVVIVAVLLFVVLRQDNSGKSAYEKLEEEGKIGKIGKSTGANGTDPKGSAALTTIVVKGGKPVGGVAELTYDEGEQVRFKVESDVSDEVHMHGYDIAKDVEAGGSVSFDFPASIEGVFEAELEHRQEKILELTVNP